MNLSEVECFCKNNKIKTYQFIDFMQEYGYISDNCINAEDANEEDMEIAWKDKEFYIRFKTWRKAIK